MNPIVSISATSRPDNFTARALAVINAELSELVGPLLVFDGREMSLSFPGHGVTEDARPPSRTLPGLSLPRRSTTAASRRWRSS